MASDTEIRRIPPLVLYISGFLDMFGVSMLLPLMMAHSRDLGATPTMAGIYGSVYGAIQLFSSPVIGSWSDIKGRQFTLMVCLFLTGFGYSIYSIARTITLMFIGRIPLGIFKHSQAISKAYLAEVTPKDEQAMVLGNFNAASSLGFIVGPAVGGNIAERPQGFYLVALLTTFIFFVNGGMIWLFSTKTETRTHKITTKDQQSTDTLFNFSNFFVTLKKVNWRDLWDLFAIKFAIGISVLMFWSNFSLILIQKFDTTPAINGYVMSFKATVSTAIGFGIGKIAKLYSSNAKLMLHMTFLQSITLLCLAFSPSLWIFIVGLVPLAVSTTVNRVASTSVSLERSREDIGLLLGFHASCMSIARMLAPLITGVAMEISPSIPGVIGAVLSFIGVVIMLVRPQDPVDRQKKVQ